MTTWQQAEDALLAAFEYLRALPDRERGFLSAGSRSGWPEVVLDRQSDYPREPDRRVRLGLKEMALLDRVLLGTRAAALAVPMQHRALVGRVVAMKLAERGGGFAWSEVWEREGGRKVDLRTGLLRRCTSDDLRKAYERAVGKVAAVLDASAVAACG